MAKAAKKPAKPKKPGKPAEKNKGGRPSKYSVALVESICARLAKGEPLAAICRDDGMPDPSTVWDWEKARPDVSQAIARARETGYDAIAAYTLEIADDSRNDFLAKLDAEGVEVGIGYNAEHVQRSKLRIETRLKLLAKWDPKRYGDKVQLAGHDGGELVAPQFVVLPVATKE